MVMGEAVNDLTIIFYTANRVSDYFMASVLTRLKLAAFHIPVVCVSQKPMSMEKHVFNLEQNICLGDIGWSTYNIFKQQLIGAKAAKTKYVALAEDDILYHHSHFHTEFRPRDDEFAYDMHKWGLYTWDKTPVYSQKLRRTSGCIAPRELLIETLEERFAKYPDPAIVPYKFWAEPGRYEKELGVTVRKQVEFYAWIAHIIFSHEDALGYQTLQNRKMHGIVKAYDIPFWGRAEEVMKLHHV